MDGTGTEVPFPQARVSPRSDHRRVRAAGAGSQPILSKQTTNAYAGEQPNRGAKSGPPQSYGDPWEAE